MRFLANENFPAAAVTSLATAGHDIVWVRIVSPGASDSAVMEWAAREQRILLTFDKDFGGLAGASTLPAGCGVVLFRVPMQKPGGVCKQLVELVEARSDWANHFSVVEPGRVRMRPLNQRA